MLVEQRRWDAAGWNAPASMAGAQVVLVFGSPAVLRDTTRLTDVVRAYPGAPLFGCSTAGELSGIEVTDETLVSTAVRFEHSTIRIATASVTEPGKSFDAGRLVGEQLAGAGLTHVLILSDGLRIDGTALVRGLAEVAFVRAHHRRARGGRRAIRADLGAAQQQAGERRGLGAGHLWRPVARRLCLARRAGIRSARSA